MPRLDVCVLPLSLMSLSEDCATFFAEGSAMLLAVDVPCIGILMGIIGMGIIGILMGIIGCACIIGCTCIGILMGIPIGGAIMEACGGKACGGKGKCVPGITWERKRKRSGQSLGRDDTVNRRNRAQLLQYTHKVNEKRQRGIYHLLLHRGVW